jgi:hypothetical protein
VDIRKATERQSWGLMRRRRGKRRQTHTPKTHERKKKERNLIFKRRVQVQRRRRGIVEKFLQRDDIFGSDRFVNLSGREME